MSETVVAFKRKEENVPHCSGEAKCFACHNKWVAVAPVGASWMQCPKCELMRGRFVHPTLRDLPHWECSCGCDIFHLVPDGVYCPNCGVWQSGF